MNNLVSLLFVLISINSFSQVINTSTSVQKDSIENRIEKIEEDFSRQISEQKKIITEIKTELSKKESKNDSDIFISLFSVLIAFGLLILTFVNNRNNNRILAKQIDQQKGIYEDQQQIQRALQRPVVDAYRSGWKDKTELIMINYGLGPAVLEKIIFEKEGYPQTSTISDLIDIKKIDNDIWWDDKWNYSDKDYYLYPQQTEKLYTITKEQLMKKYKKSETEAENIIEAVRAAREGITLKIKYVDIISKENPDKRVEHKAEIKLYDEKTSG